MNYLGTSMHDAVFTGESAAALKDKAFHAVKFDNDGNVALCDTEGEVVLGVLPAEEGNKAKGDTITVQIKDIALIVAGGEIAAGAAVTTDANGKAKAATAGNFIIGYAMKAATGAGKVIPVQIAKGVMQGGSGGSGGVGFYDTTITTEDGESFEASNSIDDILSAHAANKLCRAVISMGEGGAAFGYISSIYIGETSKIVFFAATIYAEGEMQTVLLFGQSGRASESDVWSQDSWTLARGALLPDYQGYTEDADYFLSLVENSDGVVKPSWRKSE